MAPGIVESSLVAAPTAATLREAKSMARVTRRKRWPIAVAALGLATTTVVIGLAWRSLADTDESATDSSTTMPAPIREQSLPVPVAPPPPEQPAEANDSSRPIEPLVDATPEAPVAAPPLPRAPTTPVREAELPKK